MSRRNSRNRVVGAACIAVAMLVCLIVPRLAYADGSESGLPASKLLTQFRLDTWGVRDGLPGYDLTSLAQTSDGYIWIGSTQGLIRFDGANFTVFNSSNVPGLTNNTIRALSVGRDGNLLVGAEWCAYGELVHGAYQRHYTEPGGFWNATHYFHQSPDGTLWVGYQGWNMLLRERDNHVSVITIHGVYMAGAVDLPNGDLLAGMNYGGLFRVTHDGKVLPFVTDKPMAGDDITSMIDGGKGSAWIGTDNNGLYRLQGNHLTHYSTANGLHSNTIRCLCMDESGRLWVGTNSGIDCLGMHGWEHFGTAQGLAGENVTAIMQGREGNVWAVAGLYLNRLADTHLTPVSLGPGALCDIFQINAVRDGSLLCGTRGGLWRLPPIRGALPQHLSNSLVTGATEAHNGDLITWWPLDLTRYIIQRMHQGKALQYTVNFVPIRVDDNGNELDAYGQTAQFQRLPIDKTFTPLAPTFPNLVVYDIKRDMRGNTWFATTSGLMRLQGTKIVPVDVGLPPGAHALSLDVSDPDNLWIATDHGLARVDSRTLKAASIYTTADGLPSNEFLQMVRDDTGTIWLGGYFGICSVKASELIAHDSNPRMAIAVSLYTAGDGVRSYPYVDVPAKMPDGSVWFVGHNGLTCVDPAHMHTNMLRPPVAIEQASLDGVALHLDGRPNSMSPGEGALTVRFAGLSFVQPEKVRFRYRLDGFDKGWVDAGTQRLVSYTNLPPGAYTFSVIACNNDGVWAVQDASVSFVLAPHVYETGWFKGLIGLILLAVVATIFRLRTRSITLRNRELERKVDERTAELTDANKRLIANQAEIEAQNDELQSIQSELEAQNEELLSAQASLAAANERLEALATTDGLTGLYNHRTFHTRLEEEWARHIRYGTSLSLILIDVDKFKQFNDTYGHPAGDEVLRNVARILKSTVRAGDTVARYGGEEFAVIAPEADMRYATNLAERLRKALEGGDWPMRQVTGSFGVSTADMKFHDPAELIAAADTALYHSKHNGRNQVSHARKMKPATDVDAPSDAPSDAPADAPA